LKKFTHCKKQLLQYTPRRQANECGFSRRLKRITMKPTVAACSTSEDWYYLSLRWVLDFLGPRLD